MRVGRRRRQEGFSLIELLLVVAVILITAAIAFPLLVRARISANEASATASLRTISAACENYALAYNIGYPASLANLGPAAIPSSTTANLLDSVLAAGVKSGYSFSYSAGSAADGVINTYAITAIPVNPGVSGQRSFYTDQGGVFRASATGIATASDPPLAPNDEAPVTAQLVKVSVFSFPNGADVYADDDSVPNKAPATLKLPPGKHALKVTMAGFKDWYGDITTDAGSDLGLTATLERLN